MWQNTDQNNSKCGYFLRNGSAVGDDEYNNSKILYTLLKMRDLSNLNDLHNTQDVILFCEIVENRFQDMFDKRTYNPKKRNSANKLRGCIQHD